MGDVGEDFNALKKYRKEKKSKNLISSTNMLNENRIAFKSRNLGNHLIVEHNSFIVDFWPSTGKWISRRGQSGRGVFNLINLLKGVGNERGNERGNDRLLSRVNRA
jgi:hypothetical protein